MISKELIEKYNELTDSIISRRYKLKEEKLLLKKESIDLRNSVDYAYLKSKTAKDEQIASDLTTRKIALNDEEKEIEKLEAELLMVKYKIEDELISKASSSM